VLLSVMQADAINLRTVFGWSLGRFLLVPIAALALTAPSGVKNASRWLLGVIAINAALAMPLGWAAPDRDAAIAAAAIAVPFTAAIAIASMLRRRTWMASSLAAIACVIAVGAATGPRARLRHEYYRAAAEGRAFSTGKDIRGPAAAHALWRETDQTEPLRLAVAAGWAGMSPLGARYPLLGTRLQNRVVYVPVTASGEIMDRPDYYARDQAGDIDAWLSWLVMWGIDRLVVLPPASIEGRWALRNPEVFAPIIADAGDAEAVYRFDADQAEFNEVKR
jgi:hypothetical protein